MITSRNVDDFIAGSLWVLIIGAMIQRGDLEALGELDPRVACSAQVQTLVSGDC